MIISIIRMINNHIGEHMSKSDTKKLRDINNLNLQDLQEIFKNMATSFNIILLIILREEYIQIH